MVLLTGGSFRIHSLITCAFAALGFLVSRGPTSSLNPSGDITVGDAIDIGGAYNMGRGFVESATSDL